MIKPSAPKTIHEETFDKMCKVLNRVHHVRRTDNDLRIPTVVWVYRTICKTLTTQVLPKLKYEAGAIIVVEHMKSSPCITTLVDMTVCADRNEEITQLQEVEHIRLEE